MEKVKDFGENTEQYQAIYFEYLAEVNSIRQSIKIEDTDQWALASALAYEIPSSMTSVFNPDKIWYQT